MVGRRVVRRRDRLVFPGKKVNMGRVAVRMTNCGRGMG